MWGDSRFTGETEIFKDKFSLNRCLRQMRSRKQPFIHNGVKLKGNKEQARWRHF